ncbi:hypothetical protein [Clostridium sp. Marseille-P299]|uniref:hypothetical protein n=1 Tax=Clostridium sp. Marseille-P299 TaxID=1805477 RepID=UPI00082E0052|nr:hypothetical protein [Clostridium sp. Marseille-P299]
MGAIKRETKRKLLSLIHDAQARVDKIKVNGLLKNYSTNVIKNEKPLQVKSIVFIITRMVRFHGGQTSILRLGTELSKLGYNVGYAVYKAQTKEEMELCARSNLESFQGKLYTMYDLDDLKNILNPDVVIATSWDTVSFAKQFRSYRMYFVQDYEPYFYPFGEQFLLAKKTYEQGLHMVSLGSWNKMMIETNCSPVSPIDVVEFPYEKKEYPLKNRQYEDYKSKKQFVIAVYLKYYGKRLPCILQYMLTEVQNMFAKDGITLDVQYYGEAKSFKAKGGKNLGMLNKKELLELYQRADFGIVASMSNVSLVPYEMLATGLPLIEFKDGTFDYFFPDNCAALVDISPNDLYIKMKECIQNPEIMRIRQENANAYLKTLSWEKTGKEFSQILKRLI